jgi:hypothetical protein
VGMLHIRTWGSFPRRTRLFRAQISGHAVAVDDAIAWLTQVREEAETLDRELRAKGQVPDDGFHEADSRGLLKSEVSLHRDAEIIRRVARNARGD